MMQWATVLFVFCCFHDVCCMIASFASRSSKCFVTLRPHKGPTDFASTMPQMPSTLSVAAQTRQSTSSYLMLRGLSHKMFEDFIRVCESCLPSNLSGEGKTAMRRDLLALLNMRSQGYLTDAELLLASKKVCDGA